LNAAKPTLPPRLAGLPRATLAGGPLVLLGVIGWMLLAWRRSIREARHPNPERERGESARGA
jgi:hypothetical protein